MAYDAIFQQDVLNEDGTVKKIVYSKPQDMAAKNFTPDQLTRPSEEQANEIINKTRDAINVALGKGKCEKKGPEFFRYTPRPDVRIQPYYISIYATYTIIYTYT